MAPLANPSINAPHLTRPPSLSPVSSYQPHWQDHDPILRNLSPTKTLRALNQPSSPNQVEYNLMKSVEHASAEDKDFCLRVAQACKDLREWAGEVESWEWPGTFEPPSPEERTSKRRRLLSEHSPTLDLQVDVDSEGAGFYGSLPIELVQAYEKRIEQIQQAVEQLNVEELKNHVRSVHILPKSTTGGPSQEEYVSFRVRSVDDFTALITASILQALPYLTWLTRLLNEWSVRLLILRKVPGFLQGLGDVDLRLQSAWDELNVDYHDLEGEDVSGVRHKLQTLQHVLGSKVSALGQRLDIMLDELAGRPETLPEDWINHLEELETAYSDWVVRAERALTGLAWEFDIPSSNGPLTPTFEGLGFVTDINDEPESHAYLPEPAIWSSTSASALSHKRSESPTLGQRPMKPGRLDSVATLGALSVRDRQDSSVVRLVDDVISESQHQADDQEEIPAEGRELPTYEAQRKPIPMTRNLQPPRIAEEPHDETISPIESIRSPSHHQRSRSRHVPIDVQPYVEAANVQSSPPQESDVPALETDQSIASVASRRMMFNGDLENKQILLKASSPVRPFEHASTAFTKLFKQPGHVRNKSSSSRNTLKKKYTPSHKSGPSYGSSKRLSGNSITGASIRDARRRSADLNIIETTEPEVQVQDWSDKMVVEDPQFDSPNQRFDSPMDQAQDLHGWASPRKSPSIGAFGPSVTIGSDAFEQMFVDTLPTSPVSDAVDPLTDDPAAFADYMRRLTMSPAFSDRNSVLEPRMYETMLYENNHRRIRERGRELMADRGFHSPHYERSPTSTPEIGEAESVGFAKAQQVMSPRLKSARRPEASVPQDPKTTPEFGRAELTTYADGDADRSGESDGGVAREVMKNRSRSANRPSLRVNTATAPVQEVKSAKESDTRTPVDIVSFRIARNRSGTHDSEPSFPLPPTRMSMTPTRHSREPSAILAQMRTDSERNAVGQSLGAVKPRPLTLVNSLKSAQQSQVSTPARSERFGLVTPISGVPPSLHSAVSPMSPAPRSLMTPLPPRKSEKREETGGDHMDQQVSRVLRQMKSTIEFTPTQNRVQQLRQEGPISSPYRPNSMVLAPASPPEPSLKKHVKDGTKLYHLSQPGRAQPMKLFIRLVGPEERVMVRIGGGWMDLEDYLLNFAKHHTSKTLNRDIEVTEATRVDTPSRSSSRLGMLNDFSSSPNHHASMIAHVDSSPAELRFDTPTDSSPPTLKNNPLFPRIAAHSQPRRSTSNATARNDRSVSREPPTGAEMEQHKARWVQDMLSQARAQQGDDGTSGRKSRSSWQILGRSSSVKSVAPPSAARSRSAGGLLDDL